MDFFKKICLSLLSSLIFALAIPNEFLLLGSVTLGFVALIPLYYALIYAKNRKETSVLFGIWLAAMHLMSSFWLAYFRDYAVFTLGATTVAYFFIGMLFGPAFFELARIRKKTLRPLAFACLWVFWEWIKSSGFLAYPWGTLSLTAYRALWLKQIADITGVWGIGFVIAFTSFSLAEIGRAVANVLLFSAPRGRCEFSQYSRKKNNVRLIVRLSAAVIVLCGICAVYSAVQLQKPLKKVDNLKLAIVQANTDSWNSNFSAEMEKTIMLTEDILKNAQEPDLIIWNEGSLIYSFPLNLRYYYLQPEAYSFAAFMEKNNIPLLAGTSLPLKSISEEGTKYFTGDIAAYQYNPADANYFANSVCLISPDCRILDYYNKMHLVPFAEYMPFIENQNVRNMFKTLVGFSSSYIPGKDAKLISLSKQDGTVINFAAPICFEDAFPSLCANLHNLGSELMINLTDDSWSQTRSAEYQHFVVASFRAIELRTTLIRSTNTGYSCIVDPKGQVTDDLPLFTAAALYAAVPIYEYRQSFYARFQDWLPMCCFVAVLIFIIYGRFILSGARSAFYTATGMRRKKL